MSLLRNPKNGAPKMMLGFIVRRCAADLGHAPSPDEFAQWANARREGGHEFCLFGKPISPSVAKVMFTQPGRLVTVNGDSLDRSSKSNRR